VHINNFILSNKKKQRTRAVVVVVDTWKLCGPPGRLMSNLTNFHHVRETVVGGCCANKLPAAPFTAESELLCSVHALLMLLQAAAAR
jgi:hypothetical protein